MVPGGGDQKFRFFRFFEKSCTFHPDVRAVSEPHCSWFFVPKKVWGLLSNSRRKSQKIDFLLSKSSFWLYPPEKWVQKFSKNRFFKKLSNFSPNARAVSEPHCSLFFVPKRVWGLLLTSRRKSQKTAFLKPKWEGVQPLWRFWLQKKSSFLRFSSRGQE